MAFQVFAPPIPPGPTSRIFKKYRVISTKFGDGYEQRGTDGLNPVVRNGTLIWQTLTTAEMVALEAFFDGLGGTQAFTYQFPGEPNAWVWTIDNSNSQPFLKTALTPTTFSLQVVLMQVYDIE